jgi:hypothetical protein
MSTTNTAKPMPTFHSRSRRPAVIIAIQSRQASRISCRANHKAVPGRIMAFLSPSFRGARSASPESIVTTGAAHAPTVVMDSGQPLSRLPE